MSFEKMLVRAVVALESIAKSVKSNTKLVERQFEKLMSSQTSELPKEAKIPLDTLEDETVLKNNTGEKKQIVKLIVNKGKIAFDDEFAITCVNAIHPVTKKITDKLKRFKIADQMSGIEGSTGEYKITPPIIPEESLLLREVENSNVDTAPANGANLRFLNKHCIATIDEPLKYMALSDIFKTTLKAVKPPIPPVPPAPTPVKEKIVEPPIVLEGINDLLNIEYQRLNNDMVPIINIIKKYGSERLSEVDSKYYQQIIKEVQEYGK